MFFSGKVLVYFFLGGFRLVFVCFEVLGSFILGWVGYFSDILFCDLCGRFGILEYVWFYLVFIYLV